ncbi:MAG: S41 family peptidase [Phycisphaerales bacterium JB060]
MRPTFQAVLTTLLLLLPTLAFAQDFSSGRQRERSPFTDVKFQGESAHVLIDGEWYQWRALDGVPYQRIRAKAVELAPGDWQRRLSEDLLAVLAELGIQPGKTVRLELRPIENDAVLVKPAVAMTNDKRNMVWRNRWIRAERDRRARLAQATVDADLVFNELISVVQIHHAYADLKGLDLQKLKRELTEHAGANPTASNAILVAQRFIARLGDGHARVDDWQYHAPPGRLDFLLQHAKDGVVAFHRDTDQAQGAFLDPVHPYVASMDGVPIERWIEAASAYVVDGSPALVRRRSTELLRYANLVRDELELPHAPTVVVALRNADGSSTKDIELPITDARGIYGVWPRHTTRILDSGFGYIRLESMSLDADDLAGLNHTLDSMANTPGLIIDVRDNGGGLRDAINTLVPYFLDPDNTTAARVVNVARARLAVGDDPANPNGFLSNRHAFPAAWPGWSPIERAEIDRFDRTFDPQWQPSTGRFSDPHYMVVSRQDGQPVYNKPVVVLMDEGCFSATDIFLGAMKGLPNVTLIGTPSSGGSARSNGHDIDSLGVEIGLATMVSYAPDGKLYDGNGITPDAHVTPTATDLIGHTDTQLDAAIEHLRAKAQ